MNTNVTTQPPQQMPGLSCPRCHGFIQTSIVQLVSGHGLTCPHCQLQLRVNQSESRNAMDILRKIQSAQDNLERKSRF